MLNPESRMIPPIVYPFTVSCRGIVRKVSPFDITTCFAPSRVTSTHFGTRLGFQNGLIPRANAVSPYFFSLSTLCRISPAFFASAATSRYFSYASRAAFESFSFSSVSPSLSHACAFPAFHFVASLNRRYSSFLKSSTFIPASRIIPPIVYAFTGSCRGIVRITSPLDITICFAPSRVTRNPAFSNALTALRCATPGNFGKR